MSDPFETFVRESRRALRDAGTERVDLEGRVYWRGGRGAPLVLIHGVNDQAGTWFPVVPALMQRHRLIIVDLAGHGESEPREGALPMTRILGDLHAVIEAEEAYGIILAGNSMGGWVSMLYALAHPERVARLVLEDASGMAWPITVPLVARTREEAAVILRAVQGPEAVATDEALDALMAQGPASPMMRVVQGGILSHLIDQRLPDVDLPVTLIWGEHDGLLPLAYAEALHRRIKGSTLHVIEGAAHIPHRQQPARFVACLNAID